MKPTFEEQYPGYKLIKPKTRWAWPFIWLAFLALVIGVPLGMFYTLGKLQVPMPNQAAINKFTLVTVGNLAESQSQKGKHEEAVQNFKSYFELGGDSANLMAEYAFSLAQLGFSDQALAWSRKAIQKEPKSKAARLINDALEKNK